MRTAAESIRWMGPALVALFLAGAPLSSHAQSKMKSSTGVVVQGMMGQTKEQQEKDDLECYRFAIAETNLDPVYVPGAIHKGHKAKPLPGAPLKASVVPTKSQIKRKPQGKPKGEVKAPKKKETKARLAANDTSSQQDKVEEYKEVYKKCMAEKGYAVE